MHFINSLIQQQNEVLISLSFILARNLIMATAPSVIEFIQQAYQKNPHQTQLNLQFMDISNLLPYLKLLGQFKKLKKLSLHGNSLRQLPTDISILESLEELDLSNNLLIDVQMVLISLKTLPKLNTLIFQVRKQKQKKIVQQLKSLKSFNHTKVYRELVKKQKTLNILNDRVLGDFCIKIMRDYKEIAKAQRKYLDEDCSQVSAKQEEVKFEKQIRYIAQQAIEKLDATKDKAIPSLQHLVLSTTKHQIYEHLKLRALNLCTDIYGDLGRCMKTVLQQQDNLFKSVLEQSLKLCNMEYQVKEAQQQRQKHIDVDPEERFYNKLQTMQKQIKRLKKQKEEMVGQINQLESDNSRYINLMVKFSKGDKIASLGLSNFGNQVSSRHKAPQPLNTQHKLGSHTFLKPDNKKPNHGNFTNAANVSNYSTTGRNITLKQLKDTIQQIYESKIKFDQKNFDGKLPRQTMNQYIFTYLNQKYGLKSLTVDAANSIISGIQSYSAQDNDVAVFGKILRNEIDEQFRNVQSQLKTTINDLLKMHIKAKNNYKSASQINQIHGQKINGQISFEQCKDLVQYLYNQQDAEQILKKLELRFKLNANTNRQVETSTRRGHRQRQQNQQNDKLKRKIKFSIFLQCVLDFQMRNHEKLLKPLIRAFKIQDKDMDGIIKQQQFVAVIQSLCEEAAEIMQKLLEIVDPYETKSITFTQMVRLLANYPQNSPVLGRFIDNQEPNRGQDQQADY